MKSSTFLGLMKAAHFGPTVLVVTISIILSLTQYSIQNSFAIGFAIFAGQLFFGWTNDYLDFPLDRAASRIKKPLVSGEISQQTLKLAIPISLISAVLLSAVGPMGLVGTTFHLLGLLSATLYNLKLKATIFSPLPYLIYFGLVPWAIYAPVDKVPPTWVYLGFALFACAFHFLNVLKDLDWDIEQKVLGLPQRLGSGKSILVAIFCTTIGVLLIIFKGPSGF